MRSEDQLRQIMLAMLQHHDQVGTFPAPAIEDSQGRPLLSWRVAILPYLDEAGLFNRFALDEPWDSPHNMGLLPRMPSTFALPGVPVPQPFATHYRVFVGPNTPFEGKGVKLREIPDG